MRRFLATLVVIVVIALMVFAAVFLADRPGAVSLVWNGWRVDTSVAVLVLAVAAVIVAGGLAIRILGAILGAPAAFRKARRERRRREGYRALTQGMVAVAAGEAAEAQRLARKADALLAEPPLTLLLQAQAAQLTGDEGAARTYFTAMLARPETEFLGLRALLTQALRDGDDPKALHFAERARRLRPRTGWALASLAELQARAGQWAAAEATLAQVIRRRALGPAEGRRALAAILLERSREAAAAGDPRGALALSGRANDVDALPAAAAWHATLLRDSGRLRQAARALEAAWRAAPQPDLAEVYRTLASDEPPLARLKRFERLAAANPDHAETHLVMAEMALKARLWGEARRHLERLGLGEEAGAGTSLPPAADPSTSAREKPSPEPLSKGCPARACRLMAEVEEAERGDGARARVWLQRAAAAAALDPAYVCGKCGTASRRWTALCPQCRALASLDWRAPAHAPRAELAPPPGEPKAPPRPPDIAALPAPAGSVSL